MAKIKRMSLWNLGGINPKYRDFTEKHPDKTMIGMSWAFYWRFGVLFIIIEILLLVTVSVVGLLSKGM